MEDRLINALVWMICLATVVGAGTFIAWCLNEVALMIVGWLP